MELVFDCHNYSKLKKVKLTATEFSDYAIVWWDQLVVNRRRNRERPIETWEEMKTIMKRRFVPSHYYCDLYQKLQSLTQDNQSVEDYYKEMGIAMTRANIDEYQEATMARFLAGLNHKIANLVELHHYVEFEDLVHIAIKIENQLKRKGSNIWQISSFGSPWKANYVRKKENQAMAKPKIEQKQETTSYENRGKSDFSTT